MFIIIFLRSKQLYCRGIFKYIQKYPQKCFKKVAKKTMTMEDKIDYLKLNDNELSQEFVRQPFYCEILN